ncbi:S1/P1 nuclease [Mucilaginibacter pedocola]|uniref:S1/P1 Nuclease n=1 Tax=Mucilaginibacter pedocola TaxID=1792845 RepID=A0A1S9PBB1_9SPHI|nr:S1/P1 nuclease [Mucilaginibacter pedocola]OOQ58266.1 hypothetical protein BC343_11565 [Mucilaginibacter pedocola]
MKKRVLSVLAVALALVLVSWGFVGHQAVGIIAEKHLTPEASKGVKLLLGSDSLKDVANWADDIIDEKTFPQHFINVPLGLSRGQFDDEITNQPQDNVYKAIQAKQVIIKNPGSSFEEKQQALKFLVHFVGDLHQPFHVSRKEDQGGNTIMLKFDGRDVNLHSLWDSRLISKQGLSSAQMSEKLDTASATQIKQWQADDLKTWLWESYQLSTRLYDECKPGTELGEEFYQSHIGIVNERVEKAGIRLAGLLNVLFTPKLVKALEKKASAQPAAAPVTYTPIEIADAAKHIGETVSITTEVAGIKELDGITLIDLGAAQPNTPLTMVFRGDARAFAGPIKTIGTKLTIHGKVADRRGKPQIEITKPAQLIKL